ncbi:MAG: Holliday junction resolvase RuvX [Candidatus Wenzhouxiangella sp. M2_3B_020]
MPEPGASVVLGIDYGARRIGVATGNTLTGTAHPLETVRHDGDPFEALDRIIREWRPGRIIVGLPLTADGEDSATTRAARGFADAMRERHPGIDVRLQDERYSSRIADDRFTAARREGRARRRDARNLDSVAAAVIVESWLATHEAPP